MKCSSCGSEINEDAKFCPNCGASFEQTKEEIEEVKEVYCKNCGVKLSGGAVFCTNCGTSVKGVAKPGHELADWGKRVVAWLIDIIILGLITGPWISLPSFVLIPELRGIPFVNFGTNNLIHFLYWMVMESIYGQSIGKMVMKIKVTKLDGKPVGLSYAAVESIGKAFLLPIDCIIGWILYSNKNQRLFNYLSETIVVRT